MQGRKVITAGALGGMAMFVWGAVAHMALPLGEMGMRDLPNEHMFIPAMKMSIKERGWYRIPPMNLNDTSEAAQKAREEKVKTGPLGVLIFDPDGMKPMWMLLMGEFLSNVLAGLLLAAVLSGLNAGKATGFLVGAGMGLFGWLAISASYWNWYRFPTVFTMSEMMQQLIGGALTGLAIGWVLSRRKLDKPPLF
ncbi:MAG TPA: hypothetical protein VJZ71_17115 [Phycisphaerae bacterium]|nr:hypothetical protein [Phycisphaerae bacterium]